MKSISIIIAFGFLLIACSSGHGNMVQGGELTVYFPNVEDEQLATDIANYWKENDLLTDKPQDLQILRIEDGYQLLVIENEKNDDITFSERKLLLGLQDSLRNRLNINNLEIAIANNKFQVVHKIDQ